MAGGLALAAGGCTHDPPARRSGGVVHVVRPGETPWRIARRYGADLDAVLRANGIRDVTEVPVGTRLWIPAPADPTGGRAVPARIPPPASAGDPDREVAALGLAFAWPLRGSLNSRFGRGGGGGRSHDGLDLGAPGGTAVRASEAGKVIFSDRLGAYGNVVIVKHLGDFSTVYAHHRRNRVSRGEFVEKGQVLGEVGTSGNASGPHLHFEIRRGQTPLDPLRYLP